MRRVRSGPSIAEFLHYYVPVLLSKKGRTKRELIDCIKQESADNRSYRRSGRLWVSSGQMEEALRHLQLHGLVKHNADGKWQVTRAGRHVRDKREEEHKDGCDAKEEAADALVALMTPPASGGRVLDVGTGEGFLAFKIAERGWAVLGVDSGSFDYSKDSIEKAKGRAKSGGGRVEFRRADVTQLSELNSSFDYVVSSQAMHCMSDQAACLRAIHGLLKPGGPFLCVDFAVGLKGFLCHGFHSFLAISREEWARLLPECGFEGVRFHPVGDYLVVEARRPRDGGNPLAPQAA